MSGYPPPLTGLTSYGYIFLSGKRRAQTKISYLGLCSRVRNGVEKCPWSDFCVERTGSVCFFNSLLAIDSQKTSPEIQTTDINRGGEKVFVSPKSNVNFNTNADFGNVAGHKLRNSGYVALHYLLTTLNGRERQKHSRQGLVKKKEKSCSQNNWQLFACRHPGSRSIGKIFSPPLSAPD